MERRNFLGNLGLGGSAFALGGVSSLTGCTAPTSESKEINTLYEVIKELPVDDTHCHIIKEEETKTSPDAFLKRICLAYFPIPLYFPEGVYQKWATGDVDTKRKLDKQYGITKAEDEAMFHFKETTFVKAMVKEMAAFLKCKPTLADVIKARNERGKNYGKYVNDLMLDSKYGNLMLDLGYPFVIKPADEKFYEKAMKPGKVRRILRVETIQTELFKIGEDWSIEELTKRFLEIVTSTLDKDSFYGMKSYILPLVGLLKPIYDAGLVKDAWDKVKKKKLTPLDYRAGMTDDLRLVLQYLVTLAQEECLKRDMPMQYHCGDGEPPSVTLRNQNPYFLEEMVRFDKDGMIRRPKIIPVHAGYPLVGNATWMSHLYTNCYFEISLMNPLVNLGLVRYLVQAMECVPISKILFGSDGYHVPELHWLAAKWGKLYLSQALSVFVENKVLTQEEAIEAAHMILYKNNRRVYNLKD